METCRGGSPNRSLRLYAGNAISGGGGGRRRRRPGSAADRGWSGRAVRGERGSFREDLYYRLNVVALRTPSLRERGSDLDVLIDHFLAKLAEKHGRDKRLSPEARAALRMHSWPGNVRELQNETERVWVLSGDEPAIGLEHLSRPLSQAYLQREARTEALAPAESAAAAQDSGVEEEPLTQVLERVERQTIERVLAKVSGNRSRAAQLLGISRRNLLRKLELLGLASADDATE
jgi:DNA-binding NtrC family response regulator